MNKLRAPGSALAIVGLLALTACEEDSSALFREVDDNERLIFGAAVGGAAGVLGDYDVVGGLEEDARKSIAAGRLDQIGIAAVLVDADAALPVYPVKPYSWGFSLVVKGLVPPFASTFWSAQIKSAGDLRSTVRSRSYGKERCK